MEIYRGNHECVSCALGAGEGGYIYGDLAARRTLIVGDGLQAVGAGRLGMVRCDEQQERLLLQHHLSASDQPGRVQASALQRMMAQLERHVERNPDQKLTTRTLRNGQQPLCMLSYSVLPIKGQVTETAGAPWGTYTPGMFSSGSRGLGGWAVAGVRYLVDLRALAGALVTRPAPSSVGVCRRNMEAVSLTGVLVAAGEVGALSLRGGSFPLLHGRRPVLLMPSPSAGQRGTR